VDVFLKREVFLLRMRLEPALFLLQGRSGYLNDTGEGRVSGFTKSTIKIQK